MVDLIMKALKTDIFRQYIDYLKIDKRASKNTILSYQSDLLMLEEYLNGKDLFLFLGMILYHF